MSYNRKSITIITQPVAAPISLIDMKAYLRVDDTSDDDLIQDFIDSATESIKQHLQRSLITETLELVADRFNAYDDDERLLSLGSGVHMGSKSHYLSSPNRFDLPFAPIQSVTSVKTFNRANVEAVFDASNYQLDAAGGRIYLNEGVTWPQNLRYTEAVRVRYVSGYGDAASDIPTPIVQAIRMQVGKMYDCREACGLTKACMSMLAPYRIVDNLGFS